MAAREMFTLGLHGASNDVALATKLWLGIQFLSGTCYGYLLSPT